MTMAAMNFERALARRTPIYGFAADDALDTFRHKAGLSAQIASFIANEEIYGEEEPAMYLYKVREGMVRLFRMLEDGRRQIFAFLVPGDTFGLEFGNRHELSAEAVNACEVDMFEHRSVLPNSTRIYSSECCADWMRPVSY